MDKDALNSGDYLGAGQERTSDNGKYVLKLQGDGNLVLNDSGSPIWASGTDGSGASRAEMQTDGNFVLYGDGNAPVWSSNTSTAGARLIVGNNGDVIITHGGTTVWSTGTAVQVQETAASAPAPRTYVVKKGDTLSAIAKHYYGKASDYPKIVAANNIPNPDLIHPGDELVIPD